MNTNIFVIWGLSLVIFSNKVCYAKKFIIEPIPQGKYEKFEVDLSGDEGINRTALINAIMEYLSPKNKNLKNLETEMEYRLFELVYDGQEIRGLGVSRGIYLNNVPEKSTLQLITSNFDPFKWSNILPQQYLERGQECDYDTYIKIMEESDKLNEIEVPSLHDPNWGKVDQILHDCITILDTIQDLSKDLSYHVLGNIFQSYEDRIKLYDQISELKNKYNIFARKLYGPFFKLYSVISATELQTRNQPVIPYPNKGWTYPQDIKPNFSIKDFDHDTYVKIMKQCDKLIEIEIPAKDDPDLYKVDQVLTNAINIMKALENLSKKFAPLVDVFKSHANIGTVLSQVNALSDRYDKFSAMRFGNTQRFYRVYHSMQMAVDKKQENPDQQFSYKGWTYPPSRLEQKLTQLRDALTNLKSKTLKLGITLQALKLKLRG